MGAFVSQLRNKKPSPAATATAAATENKNKTMSTSTEPTTTTSTSTTAPQAFKHYAKAQETFRPPLIANGNAFLGDVFTSQKLAPEAPVSCGFYRLEAGPPLDYTYTYHEMKIILDGEFDISDETGQKVHAVKGDVFYFPKGSKIKFETGSFGLAFYTGQRAEGAA